ncbi:MAG TPA: SPFH domain-containing protein [Bacteroidia bacterium]|nr:SPFH domain-containing protein [Bacteroidia bacterium]
MKNIFKKVRSRKNFFAEHSILFFCLSIILLGQSCVTIDPGEIGLKVKRGVLSDQNFVAGKYPQGPRTSYVLFSTRVKELSLKTMLPTKEGLEAKVELTMLYHIKPDAIRGIYLTLGMNYENEVIMNNLSAIARETCLHYRAMDLMTQRDSLEVSIFKNINADVGHYGFIVDQVLIHDIDVPDEIDRAIEKKVLSEQQIKQQEVDILTQKKATDASIEKQRKEMEFSFEKQKREKESSIQQERMDVDFSVEKQKKEAERVVIEATAAKKSQELANTAITPMSIKYKTIEVLKELANSPNSKIIITDGKNPLNMRLDEK